MEYKSDKKTQEKIRSDSWDEVIESLDPKAKWADYDEDDGCGYVNNLEDLDVEQDGTLPSGLQISDTHQKTHEGRLENPHRLKERIYEVAADKVLRKPRASPREDARKLQAIGRMSEVLMRGLAASKPREESRAAAGKSPDVQAWETRVRNIAVGNYEHEDINIPTICT